VACVEYLTKRVHGEVQKWWADAGLYTSNIYLLQAFMLRNEIEKNIVLSINEYKYTGEEIMLCLLLETSCWYWKKCGISEVKIYTI